jgi:hypothetical protein
LLGLLFLAASVIVSEQNENIHVGILFFSLNVNEFRRYFNFSYHHEAPEIILVVIIVTVTVFVVKMLMPEFEQRSILLNVHV